jgi:hypothetical protein
MEFVNAIIIGAGVVGLDHSNEQGRPGFAQQWSV